MHCMRIPFPVPPWFRWLCELRIDVRLPPSDVEKELAQLHGRLNTPGDRLHDLPAICLNIPGLVLRYREADGEHYVYAEDTRRRRLAGYVVFNRLIELNRRSDPYLRAPHAKFHPDYQRRGIATAIYRWWLDNGNTLISGARQSPGAHALWRSLGQRYPLHYVDLRDKQLRYLGQAIDRQTREALHTRIIMLGKGWDRDRLAERTGMQLEAGEGTEGLMERVFRKRY